ncbi:hypothetical protein GCM10010478_17530 [Streptomyces erythrogriseus]|uniref:Uncharacterized protein n=1 Tax=Streptomyces erythrogriseus TaxID=284027 RepID=A0ABP6J277_9ACTN
MSAGCVGMGLEQPPDGRAGAGHGEEYAQVPACSVDAEDDAGRGAVRGRLRTGVVVGTLPVTVGMDAARPGGVQNAVGQACRQTGVRARGTRLGAGDALLDAKGGALRHGATWPGAGHRFEPGRKETPGVIAYIGHCGRVRNHHPSAGRPRT